jgi:hypothetical protein
MVHFGLVCYDSGMLRLTPLLVLFSLLGCAADAGVRVSDRDLAFQEGVSAARGRLLASVLAAGGEQMGIVEREAHRLLGRFNPADCNCPPFEILMRGRWVRVWLQAAGRPEGTQAPVIEEARSAGQLQLYVLAMRVTGAARTAPNESEYPVVEVTATLRLGEVSVSRGLLELGAGLPGQNEPAGSN